MKATPGPIAKISRPMLPKVVQRPRLIKRLGQALKRSIVWVCGPPGSGKTTLVASYLASLAGAVLWYQIDGADADPAAFFYYLGLAVKRVTPRHKTSLPLLTPEYGPGLEVFTRNFVHLICDRLPNTCVLVFDNYHAVSPDSAFHKVVRYFFDALPNGRHVIVISRSTPPSTLVRLYAHDAMEIIDGDSLRATAMEARSIVKLRSQLPASTISNLFEITEGWIAGIILMAKRATMLRGGEDWLPSKFTKDVFDYFSGEVFDEADADRKEFLLETAYIEKMTLNNVKGLTNNDRAEAILDDLVNQGYFTEKRDGPKSVYQYHALFREFLLKRAEATWTTRKLVDIQNRVAVQLEKDGQLEEALGCYQMSCNWNGATKMILQQASLLVTQGRNATLEQWLAALPKKVINKNPWLLYWRGISNLFFSPRISRQYLEAAFKIFSRQGDSAGSILSWSGIVNSIILEWGDFSRLDKWISWLDNWIGKNPNFPSSDIETRVICDMAQALVFRKMDHPRINTWMERALLLFRKSPEPNLRLQLSVAITNYYMWTGQFRAAMEMVNQINSICLAPGINPMVLLQAKTCAAMFICVATTSRDLTLDLVSEGLETARINGIGLFTAPIYAAAFYIYLNTGDLKLAGEYLEKVRVVQNSDLISDFGFYYLLSALLALCRGEAVSARHFAENAHEIMTQIGFPVGEVATGIALAQALYECGEYQKAIRQLRTSNQASRKIHSKIYRYMGCLTEAQISFDAGKAGSELRGIKALQEAMGIGREECYINMPGWRSAVMAKLCAKALEHGIEPEYVSHLIRVRGLIPDASSMVSEAWPWPLKIHTLGRFSIVQDGKGLRLTARSQGKVNELLKVLIAMGGRDVDEARLADIIWPDSEGDKAYQALRTTLHRLRKLLGNDEVILVQDGSVTLNPELTWVDTWAFERYLGTSDLANIEKAVALYHGRFLEMATPSSWVISLRERLHARYIRSLTVLGHHWEDAEEWTKAVTCYEKGLSVDALVEEFYQRLIYCHIRCGHRAEAKAVYKRCCESLRIHLNIAPSYATESMIDGLH